MSDEIADETLVEECGEEYEEKNLNDTWILWYHDPNDLNWDISIIKLFHYQNT